MRKYCLLFLFIIECVLSFSQPINQQTFKVVSISPKTVCTKEQLNKEIANAKTKEEVKGIIWRKIELQKAEIQIRIFKGNGQYAWWFFNKKENKEKEGDWILTQSKNTEISKIYSTDELKNILKDTLAILDTLQLTLFLQDENFSTDQYYIMASCNNTSTTKFLPYNQNSIMISGPVIPSCKSRFIHINLHNRQQPEMFLGECVLFFITEEIKNTLKDLAISVKESDSRLDLKAIVNYVSGYIERNYGKISKNELTKLLSTIPELNR